MRRSCGLRALRAAALAGLAGLLTACSPEAYDEVAAQVEASAGSAPNIVLIIADTLREDRVGGSARRPLLTPTLDSLRESGAYFANAYTTTSWTLPATASIFVSQLPSHHGVSRWDSLFGDELTALPEVLKAAGYRTGGWSANRLITRERGFRQGFDEFELLLNPNWKFGMPPESPHAFASADDVIEHALAWLDAAEPTAAPPPFFLYLHLMEAHTPFLCPDGAGKDCDKAARALNQQIIGTKSWDFSAVQQQMIERFYDSDVSVADAAIGRLRDALAARGLLEDTWFVFTSDHGEMLGEHGLYVHGAALYQETIRVPLLVHRPNGHGLRIDAPVSVIDVAPTILDAAGVPPPANFQGRSLLPALSGRPVAQRPVVAELIPVHTTLDKNQRHLAALHQDGVKWLLGIDGSVVKFDLRTDPGEQRPVAATREEFEALLSEAGVDIRSFEIDPLDAPTDLSPEMREHLRGLGYLHE